MLVVGLAIACVQYKVPTIMSTIAPQFGLDGDASSWLMSIFTLVGIFVALPAGGLAQRFGFKRVMLASFGIVLLGSVVGLLSGHNGAVLITSRAIEGVSLTLITACAPIAVQQSVRPEKIGTAMGLWGCWANGGAVLAALLTPHIFSAFGFDGVWIVFAAFSLVAAILLLLFIKQPRLAIQEEDELQFTASPEALVSKPRYRELFVKDVFLYLLGFAILNIVLLALLGMLPSVLMLPEKGFTMEMAAFASTAASLLSLISTPVAGLIADRIGRIKPILVTSFGVLGPCLFLMFTQTGVLFWTGAVLLGAVGFGCVGLIIAGWMQVVPRPGLVPISMGVFSFVQCLGGFLGTFLVSLLLGPNLGNWFFAGVTLGIVGLLGSGAILLVKFR
ncbi:MAG: CynX/NimT family MFS transporter [Coriobacteriia bacterium]